MARGFPKHFKRGRVILKPLRPLNSVFTASELEPARISSKTIKVFKILK